MIRFSRRSIFQAFRRVGARQDGQDVTELEYLPAGRIVAIADDVGSWRFAAFLGVTAAVAAEQDALQVVAGPGGVWVEDLIADTSVGQLAFATFVPAPDVVPLTNPVGNTRLQGLDGSPRHTMVAVGSTVGAPPLVTTTATIRLVEFRVWKPVFLPAGSAMLLRGFIPNASTFYSLVFREPAEGPSVGE